MEAVSEIFSLKSGQEEVSDFSFSFGQTDLCEGLIAWMSHDTEARKHHIHTLRQYVCLHQVSASTKKKYCKLLHEITNHHLISPGAGNIYIIYTYLGVSRTIYIIYSCWARGRD